MSPRTVRVPDFTDCSFNSREPAADWFAIGHDGGPARAFDRADAGVRPGADRPHRSRWPSRISNGFCDDAAWPAGELNLPRALVTEKAFPEDEAVLSTTIASGTFVNEFLYERRIGARTQYEVKVPIAVQEGDPAGAAGLAMSRPPSSTCSITASSAGASSPRRPRSFCPTGKENEGLGGGVTVFEPFVAFGQMLPADGFMQAQSGLRDPVRRRTAPTSSSGAALSARASCRASSDAHGRRWSSCSARRSWPTASRCSGTSCRRCK